MKPVWMVTVSGADGVTKFTVEADRQSEIEAAIREEGTYTFISAQLDLDYINKVGAVPISVFE